MRNYGYINNSLESFLRIIHSKNVLFHQILFSTQPKNYDIKLPITQKPVIEEIMITKK